MIKFVYVEFLLSKQQSFLNSRLTGLDQLYTGRAGGSSRRKSYLIIIYFPPCHYALHVALVVTLWPGALKVLSSITGNTYFSFFFLFNFPFTYCSFVSLYSFSFFIFINFLPYCLFSLSTSCRFPEVLREVLRFTHF